MTIERKQIKRALAASLVRIASEKTALDSEDQEMLIKYHLGEITKSELDTFAVAKARRLEQQIKRPQ
jgi:hypothetical protein